MSWCGPHFRRLAANCLRLRSANRSPSINYPLCGLCHRRLIRFSSMARLAISVSDDNGSATGQLVRNCRVGCGGRRISSSLVHLVDGGQVALNCGSFEFALPLTNVTNCLDKRLSKIGSLGRIAFCETRVLNKHDRPKRCVIAVEARGVPQEVAPNQA